MRGLFLILVLSLSIYCVLGEGNSDVLELTDATIGDALGSHPFIFVEFYAPWCGHCKQLAPEWEKAATALKGVVTLAKINADENREAAREWEIQGFPTLKWFESGRPFDYNGARDATGIINWVEKRLNPIPSYEDKSALEIARTISDVVVAFNFDPSSVDYATMRQYALSAESITFVHVSGEAAEGLAPNSVLVSSQWTEPALFTEPLESLPVWVNKNCYPLVQKIGENGTPVFTRLFTSGLPFALVFFQNNEHLESNIEQLTEVAASLHGEFLFAWLEAEIWANVLPRLGSSGTVFPAVVAWEAIDEANPKLPLIFDEDAQFSFEELGKWVRQVSDGTAVSWKVSQPIPEDNSGPVRTIVWKTFESEVVNSEVPVFLKFYSPNCVHCQNLAPAWEELATILSPSTAIIAKIDATANHIPAEYAIQGFPTLKLFIPGQAPIDYEGSRDVFSLKAFVQTMTERS